MFVCLHGLVEVINIVYENVVLASDVVVINIQRCSSHRSCKGNQYYMGVVHAKTVKVTILSAGAVKVSNIYNQVYLMQELAS